MLKLSEKLEAVFERLFEEARKARENAYAPYSDFQVGACVLSDDKKLYTGANVENKSFGLTLCAERNAIFSAVGKGERKFIALAIVADDLPMPCGACLEVMNEFFIKNAVIGVYGIKNNEKKYYRMKEILPYPFQLKEV